MSIILRIVAVTDRTHLWTPTRVLQRKEVLQMGKALKQLGELEEKLVVFLVPLIYNDSR